MKNMKRVFILLLVLAVVLPAAAQAQIGGLLVNQSALAQIQSIAMAGTQTGTDIVVLIDRSGTMDNNDPENIALEAIKELASLLVNNSGSGGINMAVIAYGYGTIAQTPGFVDISDDVQRGNLVDIVDSLAKVDSWEDTNTGVALKSAYDMIEARRSNPQYANNAFAAVLLTDGKVDVGDSTAFIEANGFNVNSRKNKSAAWLTKQMEITEESKRIGRDTAGQMAADGIKLHCVGIYADTKENLGTDMSDWVATTGGVYSTVHTKDVEQVKVEMQQIVQEINQQIDILRTTISPSRPGTFEVPVGVVQVNLQITSPEGVPPVDDPSLCSINYTTTSGQTGSYPVTASNLRVNNSGVGDPNTVIQMTQPVAGSYTVQILDNTEYIFDVNIVRIKGLIMTIGELPSVENGNSITIKMDVTTDGAFYMDQNNPPKLTIKDAFEHIVLPDASMSLYQDPATGFYSYICEFAPSAQGQYTVSAWMEKDGIRNESNVQKLTVLAAPIRVKANMTDINFAGHAIAYHDASGNVQAGYTPAVISFADLMANNFDNRDNRNVTGYRFDLHGSNAVTVVNDNAGLVITPVSATTAPVELTIWAQYDSMESEPVTGYINVQDAQAPIVLTELGTKVNGGMLESLSVSMLEPEKEAVAVAAASETTEAVLLEDVSILFSEPNFAIDGEPVKAYTVKAFDVNNTEVFDLASLDENNGLNLKVAQAGTYRIELVAQNWLEEHDAASPVSVVMYLEVKDLTMTLAMFAGAIAAAVLLVIIIIIVIIKASKPAFGKGVLSITLTCDDETYDGSVMLKRYGKKEVKLTTLCTTAGIRVGSTRKYLEKITVKPRKNDVIEIVCNFKGKNKKSIVMRSMDSKFIELDSSGDRIIEFEYDDGRGNY